MKEFHQRLRHLIERPPLWTQAEVAERVGVSEMTMNHFCCGRRAPSLKNLEKICQVFNQEEIRWLVTGRGEIGPKG